MNGTTVATIGSCAVCGAADPFGVDLCPACAARAPAADALVFVARGRDQSARAHVDAVVSAILGPGVPRTATRAAAHGEATLARAPTRVAERIVERLADEGVAAGTLPVHRAFTRVPPSLVLLVLVAAAAGAIAGVVAVPEMLWLTPLMAAGILVTAAHLAGRPLWERRGADASLPADAAAVARRALAELPEGEARRLLVELLRHARAGVTPERTDALVSAACAAAGTLGRLEEDLRVLDHGAGWDVSPARRRVRDRAEEARAGLAARLRETVTAIARLRVASRVGEAAADGRALESLTRDLAVDARYYQEALTEVTALLRDGPA